MEGLRREHLLRLRSEARSPSKARMKMHLLAVGLGAVLGAAAGNGAAVDSFNSVATGRCLAPDGDPSSRCVCIQLR